MKCLICLWRLMHLKTSLIFQFSMHRAADGWCVRELEDPRDNLHPLLDVILEHVRPPQVDQDAPFAMLATLLDS